MLRVAIAAAMERVVGLSAEVTREIVAGQPSLVEAVGVEAADVIDRATFANVGSILRTLDAGVSPVGLDVPDGALDLLDHLAVDEDALPEMLRAYRLGAAAFNVLWVAELGAHTRSVEQLTRIAGHSLAHVAAYVDRVSEVIVERWSAVVDAAQRSGRRREAALRALVRGEVVDAALLDHPLELPQLVVAWLPARAANASGVVLAAAGTAPRLDLELADGTSMAWVAAADATARVPLVLEAATGRGWCVATVAPPGLPALARATHDVLEGLAAIRRTRPDGASVTYADVVLLTTLLADETRARRLVEVVLGPLAEPTQRSRELRDTLRAYFAARERKSGASALLAVHEKTVAYRLDRVEEMLGARIDDRRAELETALLLLDAFVQPGADTAPNSP